MNSTEQIQLAETLMHQGHVEQAEKLYDELCRMEHLTETERGTALFGAGTCLFLQESYAGNSCLLHEEWRTH